MKLAIFRPAPQPIDLSSAPTKASNKWVRDFPMRGTRVGNTITIVMTIVRRQQRFTIDAADFVGKMRYDQLEILRAMFGHWDDEPGGPGQAQRLRESILNIIEQLIGTYKPPTKREKGRV